MADRIVYRPPFVYGAHVVIRPLDRTKGRVITQEYDSEGWTINVRYIDDGEAKTMKCFLDEVELEDHKAERARQAAYDASSADQPNAGQWPPDEARSLVP